MKIKEGFILRTIAKEHVVVAIGKASTVLNGIIKLNNSSAFLWNILNDGAEKDDLVSALQERYGIPEDVADRDVSAFLEVLSSVGCIE